MLKKSLSRKWAQVPTACVWAVSGQECSSPQLPVLHPVTPLHFRVHSAVGKPVCTAGQCFVHGGGLLQCVHSARRPAVRSRLAEGSGVRALLWAAGEGKVETRGGAGTPDHH